MNSILCVATNKVVLCAPNKFNFFIGKNTQHWIYDIPLVFIGNLEISSNISTKSPGFVGIGETR